MTFSLFLFLSILETGLQSAPFSILNFSSYRVQLDTGRGEGAELSERRSGRVRGVQLRFGLSPRNTDTVHPSMES